MDKTIRYTVTADANPFAAGMQRIGQVLDGVKAQMSGTGSQFGQIAEGMSQHMKGVGESISSSVTGMGGHFSGLLETVGRTSAGFVALGLAAAGLAASKAVSATAEMTEAAMDLSRVLGSTTNEAQAWRIALDDVGATQGDLEGAAKGLSRQLKENESDLQAMGLATRDAEGNLRPMSDLVAEGIGILGGYAAGADRALASQVLFGRGVDASSKLLLINGDTLNSARETMAELGLEVGSNAVAAWGEFDDASDRAHFGLKGLGNTIGTILMPVLTTLINTFNAAMPAAIVITRGALGVLATGFHAITNGVVVLWETIKAMIFTVTEPIRALGSAMVKLAGGDFKGATDEMMGWTDRVGDVWGQAMDNMVASAEETQARIAAIWAGGDAQAGTAVGPAAGGQRFTPPPKAGADKDKKDTTPSAVPYYEQMLDEERLAATERDAIKGLSKERELQFWEEILATAKLSVDEQTAVERKAAAAKLQLLRDRGQAHAKMIADQEQADAKYLADEAQKAGKLNDVAISGWQNRGLARVAIDEEFARTQLAAGEITQGELLAMEEGFEARRLQVRMAALETRRNLLDPDRDVVAIAQVNQEIEQLELQHQLRLAQIRTQVIGESTAQQAKLWADLGSRVSSLWDQGVQSLMNGTFTWAGAMRAVGAQVVGWFASQVVKPMVARWIFGEQAKNSATAAGVAQRWLMESWAAAKSVALWAATAVKNIMVSAWEAMAGAWKAIVGIPYVGPVLAPIAAGAAFAGVASLARNVASAEGGFDIPAGLNPMTQLHEREMVLPAKHADVIRNLADGTGGATPSGGGDINVSFRGASAGDFFLANKAELARAIKSLRRDNYGGAFA